MAFITSPAIFRILNSLGNIVSGNARVLQFTGEVSAVETAPGVVLITVGGPGSQTPDRLLYTGPDGDIKTDSNLSYSESFRSLAGGSAVLGPPGFFNAFQWGTGSQAQGSNCFALGSNIINQMFGGTFAVGTYNELIPRPSPLFTTDEDVTFVVGTGDNPALRKDGLRVYKGDRVQTLGSRQQRIRTVSANTTLSRHTDRVVLVDTTASAINITFPVGIEGLEYHIKNIGAIGGNNVNLIASGGNTLEVATIANTTVETSYHFMFSANRWRVLSRYE
jgi:hypothetical protein